MERSAPLAEMRPGNGPRERLAGVMKRKVEPWLWSAAAVVMAVVGSILFAAPVMWVTRVAAALHWALGMAASALFIMFLAATLWLLAATKGPFDRPWWRVWFGPHRVASFILVLLSSVLMGAAAFASLSYTMQEANWVNYIVREQPLEDPSPMGDVYLWHAIDMIPLVDAWKTLGDIPCPASFDHWIGGAPVLLFKALVIVPLVGLASTWLAWCRSDGPASPPNGEQRAE